MASYNFRKVTQAALFMAFLCCSITVLSSCKWQDTLALGWPNGVTPEGKINRNLWIYLVFASLIIGIIVVSLISWTIIFHRKKDSNRKLPLQFGYNLPLEIAVTAIPFLIVSVLFYLTMLAQENILYKDPRPEIIVDITAFQWNWKFGYQNITYSDGSFNYNGVDKIRKATMAYKSNNNSIANQDRIGTIRGIDPEGRTYLNFDKIETLGTSTEIPILVLPINKRIEFVLNSADVIHGFWVPEFLFKRDIIPEPKANNSENIFQIEKIERTGAFVGRCSEMCGTYHSMMNFEIRAIEPNEFITYINERNTGKTNSEALMTINQAPLAITTHPFDTRRGEQIPQIIK